MKDPHAKREAKKYERPIVSREYIMQWLEGSRRPQTRHAIERAFKIEEETDKEALRRRLRAMENDGQLIRLRNGCYGLVEKMDLKVGLVQSHKDGFGFVAVEGEEQDIYLNPFQMKSLFDQDRVAVRVEGRRGGGRVEGVVVEVLSRSVEQLVGRYFVEAGVGVLIPEHRRIHHRIIIPKGSDGGAESGEYVVLKLTQGPTKHRPAQGEIIERLGNYMAPGMEIDVAIRAHDIPHEFSTEALQQADNFGDRVDEKSLDTRFDYREIPFVTIDGEDARDFDDAVYAEPKAGGGWYLYVAIADVSHYVDRGSALDLEAKERGTSVYFPGRVVPMLPEQLSNHLCSLNPKADRLALVCEMSISASGKLTRYQFAEGVISSHARLTYNQVSAFLDGDAGGAFAASFDTEIQQQITDLNALFLALHQQRLSRGAIDFNTTETQILFGADQKIQDIVPRTRNQAHRIIEEMMLCANVATAKTLIKHKIPGMYRNHDGVKAEKWRSLCATLSLAGMHYKAQNLPKPTDYQALLSRIQGRKDVKVLEMLLLRSMTQAKYEPGVRGHFGLNYPAYTHFTSPIRRYPDLVVHRALRYLIRNEPQAAQAARIPGAPKLPKNRWLETNSDELERLAEHCSQTERRADEATRDVTNWLKCEYMKDRVGEVLPGIISSVVGFGLFVELQDFYIEGLIHISNLPGDYYRFDEISHQLVGEHSGQRFGLGDKIQVQVARVDIDERKIDFNWAPSDETPFNTNRPNTEKPHTNKPKQHKKHKSKKSTKQSQAKHKQNAGKSQSKAKHSKATPEKVDTRTKPARKSSKPKLRKGKKR